jgi:diacylglycerol kinase (ATP)
MFGGAGLPSPKIALVVNPVSANGITAKRWPEVETAFKEAGLQISYNFTESPEHATAITRNYLQNGYELIISVGGDGTANEVVNGFFSDGQLINPDAAVAFMSTGTGRDLGRTIGTPPSINEAVQHILKSSVRPVDLGRVSFMNNQGAEEVRHFINVAGLGLDGDTVARVNRASKALGGFVSFLWGTLVSLMLYKNKVLTIAVDGIEICSEPITVVVIGNGRYFGGGMCIAPEAFVDDGLFDIVILRGLSKPALLVNLPKVYCGKHLSHPRIKSLRGRIITVSSPEETLLDLDGEQPGRAPVRIELLPAAINMKG